MKRIIIYLILVFVVTCLPQFTYAQAIGGEIKRPIKKTTTTHIKQNNNKPAPKPKPTTGTLSISSTPSDASVKIDGEYIGTTPLKLSKRKAGTYKVTFSAEGYETTEKSVTVTAGGTATCSATLNKKQTQQPIVTSGSPTTSNDNSSTNINNVQFLIDHPTGKRVLSAASMTFYPFGFLPKDGKGLTKEKAIQLIKKEGIEKIKVFDSFLRIDEPIGTYHGVPFEKAYLSFGTSGKIDWYYETYLNSTLTEDEALQIVLKYIGEIEKEGIIFSTKRANDDSHIYWDYCENRRGDNYKVEIGLYKKKTNGYWFRIHVYPQW